MRDKKSCYLFFLSLSYRFLEDDRGGRMKEQK